MATKAEEHITHSNSTTSTTICPYSNPTNAIPENTVTTRKPAQFITSMSIFSEETPIYFANIKLLNNAMTISKSIKNVYLPSLSNSMPTEPISDTPINLLSCNTCQLEFNTREDMILHYKDDWHRYNLRLSLAGKKPVRESEFEYIATEDISSISGSDSNSSDAEGEELTQRSPPHILFCYQNSMNICSVYRELVHHRNHTPETKHTLTNLIMDIPSSRSIAVLMLSAGHFAGAIFEGETVLHHKTFHRYVLRAKRGTIQSTHDNKMGGTSRSAGAQIRRANEAALVNQIQQLLKNWAPMLRMCKAIFIRWPAQQRHIFQDKNNIYGFTKEDQRVRNIPIVTRRPTFPETKRVHAILTQIILYTTTKDVCPELECKTSEDNLEHEFINFMENTEIQTIVRDTTPIDSLNKDVNDSQVRKDVTDTSQQANTNSKKIFKKIEKKKKPLLQTDLNDPLRILFREIMKSCSNGQIQNTLLLLEKIGKPIKFTQATTNSCDNDTSEQNNVLTVSDMLNANIENEYSIDTQSESNQLLDPFRGAVLIDNAEADVDDQDTAILVNEDIIYFYDTDALIINKEDTIENVDTHKTESNLTINVCEQLQTSLSNSIQNTDNSEFDVPSTSTEIPVTPQNVSEKANTVSWDNLTQSDRLGVLNMCNMSGYTPLHIAAIKGSSPLIFHLLRYGANPSIKDKNGKVPYELAKDKVSRDAFRRFMATNPDAMDYSQTKITSPLTFEMEEEQRKKKIEKKRTKNLQRKHKKTQANKENMCTIACDPQKDDVIEASQLSDREKRALAAENRHTISKTQIMCSWCHEVIHGTDFFEKSSYIYCSIECVKSYRSYVIL